MTTDRFSEEFKEALGAYIDYLQEVLEIRDWRILLDSGYPAEGDVAAQISCTYGRRVATLELSKDFFEAPEEKQVHYIIHEVVHVMTECMDNIMENGLDKLLGLPSYSILKEAWSVQVEYFVDSLAYVIENLVKDDPHHKELVDTLMRSEQVL